MNLKETYNRIAWDWFKDHTQDTWWIQGTEKFISLLPKRATVLDVGCGAGVKTRFLKEKELDVVGVDFSEEMIVIAKEQDPTGTYFVKDITKTLDFDKTFDGVFAQAVLLHISKSDIVSVLKNLSSILKDDGYLYLAVKGQWEGGPEEHVLKENDYGYEYERFFSYYTLEEMKQYLAEVGFSSVFEHQEIVGRTNWIQVISTRS